MAFALVLVVDDDVAALASVGSILNGGGYAVAQALDGQRALQQVVAAAPDVLITELIMRDGDGIELITAVKRAHPGVRIIALSKWRFIGRLNLQELASELGADATLDKPIEPEILLATVANLIGPDARFA